MDEAKIAGFYNFFLQFSYRPSRFFPLHIWVLIKIFEGIISLSKLHVYFFSFMDLLMLDIMHDVIE